MASSDSQRISRFTLNAGLSVPPVTARMRLLKPEIFKRVTGSPVHILAGDKDDYDDPDGCLQFWARLPADVRPHFSVSVYEGATFGWDHRFGGATYEAGGNKGKGGIVNVIANPEIANESRAFAVSYFKKYLAAD